MHIAEGYLPPLHAAAWTVVAAPFVVHGARAVREDPDTKLLLGAAGAFTFVLSALKIPSVTGSSSHPTGTGLGAILFRPPVMALLGTIVLMFQALLIAHGGITTLGANGQKKRVAIAGAVAMAPRLLVLDEPTAGLDPAGVEELLTTLADLHATGTTPVLSTHDVDLAHRWADEMAVVSGGRVVTGPVDAVLGDVELLRGARLGPAWAPAVHRLLDRAGHAARPGTAAALHDLLGQATHATAPGSAGDTAP